jgi:hypothetical protein
MLEFHTEAPVLTGLRCAGVLAQEFWYREERVSAANVLFIAVDEPTGNIWHRIAVDRPLIFWRVEREPSLPQPEDDSEQYGSHRIVNVGARHGLVGRRIITVRTVELPDADELLIIFDDGTTIAMHVVRDRDETDLEIRPPPHSVR